MDNSHRAHRVVLDIRRGRPIDIYIISLRILHIVFATFWLGASLVFAFFLEPTARQLGPAGGPFMGHLVEKKRLPEVIAVTSVVAILAGFLLYWRASSGFDMDWISSRSGATFTLGGAAAVVSWVIGFAVMRPGIAKSGALRAEAAANPVAARQLERLTGRLAAAGLVNVSLLVLAAVAMSIARYL